MGRVKKTPKKGLLLRDEWSPETIGNNGKNKIVPKEKQLYNVQPKLSQQLNDNYYLGKIDLANVFDEHSKNENSLIQINIDDSESFVVQSNIEIAFLKAITDCPILFYDLSTDSIGTIFIDLYLSLFDDEDNSSVQPKHLKTLHRVIVLLFGDDYDIDLNKKQNVEKKDDINELYAGIKSHQKDLNLEQLEYCKEVQHVYLKPQLRPYQAQAVRWMLFREHTPLYPNGEPHPGYKKLTLPKNVILYYNNVTGHVTKHVPLIECHLTGGILADEMGLGKTVEVLACILCHPRNPEDITTESEPSESLNKSSVTVFNQNKTKTLKKSELKRLRKKRQSYELDHDYIPPNEDKLRRAKARPKKKTKKKRRVWQVEDSSDEDRTEIKVSNRQLRPSSRRGSVKYSDDSLKCDAEKIEDIPTNDSSVNCQLPDEDAVQLTKKKRLSSSEDSSDDLPLSKLVDKRRRSRQIDERKMSQLKDILRAGEDDQKKKNAYVKKPESPIKRITKAWYEQKLAEVSRNWLGQRPTQVLEVQCLCGSFEIFGNEVVCKGCGKKQHRSCVSYNGYSSDYCCPQCWEKEPLIKTKATLIVTPISLSKQWIFEIKKHVARNGLRVLVYKGVHTTGYLYPKNITEYDIVLTTYRVLQSEIKYVGVDSSRGLRFEKKYQTATSPLLTLEWWRICLDEAQIVESPASEVASMARKLNAINKWAISGTPAGRGINDLFALVQFFNINPYMDSIVWRKFLYNPYCEGDKQPMFEFLSKIFWRSCKVHVIDQIDIPKQTEIIYWLKFSPVEEFFYRREHEMCQHNFQAKLSHFDTLNITLSKLSRSLLSKILIPLLAIRQACTHPKVVRGKYLTTKSNMTSMEDLLEALVSKNEQECSDALRAEIAAINGIAGIHIIEGRFNEAGDCYRDVLRLIDQHKNEITVDTLPHLHTLHNLAELLADPNTVLPPTLRDDQLRKEANLLEEKYLQKDVDGIKTNKEEYDAFAKTFKKRLTKKSCEWFSELVAFTGEEDQTDDFLDRLQSTLRDSEQNSNFSENLRTAWSITYHITTWWDKVVDKIGGLHRDFEKLQEMLNENESCLRFDERLVNEAVDCHLKVNADKSTPSAKKSKCFMCQVEKGMLDYECLIFSMKTKTVKTKRKKLEENEDKTQGTWRSSIQELILKSSLSFARSRRVNLYIISNGEQHLKLCDNLKKEFKSMRKLWTYYGDLIASQDEINMCKLRLRVRIGNEEVPKPRRSLNRRQQLELKKMSYTLENKLEFINVIEIGMVSLHLSLLNRDKIEATKEFNNKLGTLAYLKTLRNRRYTGMKPDPCPICTNPLEDNWSVLQCGHSFCLECIHNLLSSYCNGLNITCSVCRQSQPVSEISYVRFKLGKDNSSTGTSSSSSTNENLDVKGSFSTKVEAIVQCVLKLYQENPKVKVLIFSQWNKVLSILSEALKINEIQFLFMMTSNVDILEKFKNEDENITALLLPVNLGAKGLNLIEATHVLLVEPLLNPAEELQAVGRVHRIGQTKPTFVHRFLIKDTIEESIFNAVNANINDWEKDNVTLGNLYDLFVKPNVSQAKPNDEESTTRNNVNEEIH